MLKNKILTGCEATQSFNDREKEWGDITAARSSHICRDGRSVIGAADERVLRDVPGRALMPPRDMFTSLPFPERHTQGQGRVRIQLDCTLRIQPADSSAQRSPGGETTRVRLVGWKEIKDRGLQGLVGAGEPI